MSEPSNEQVGSRATQAGHLDTDTTGEVADARERQEREPRRDHNGNGATGDHRRDSPNEVGAADPLVREASSFRSRWDSVQVSFVDDPRQAVSDAEALVGDVLSDLTSGFRHQRQELESIWSQGQEASTEHLRQTLQRYRDFFERLLRV
jgi:hypothetical protein